MDASAVCMVDVKEKLITDAVHPCESKDMKSMERHENPSIQKKLMKLSLMKFASIKFNLKFRNMTLKFT